MQAFANLDVADYTFTPVASISVIQSTQCLLSAIPLQQLLPPPNAPHQASKKGIALLEIALHALVSVAASE